MNFKRSLFFAPIVFGTAMLSGCLGGDSNSVVQLAPSEPLESCMVGNWLLDKYGTTTEYQFNADGTYQVHHESASTTLLAAGLVSIVLGEFVYSRNDSGFYYVADVRGSWWVEDGNLFVRQETDGSDNAYTKSTARRVSLEELNTPDSNQYIKTLGTKPYCGNDMWFPNVMTKINSEPRTYGSFKFEQSGYASATTPPYTKYHSNFEFILQDSGIVDAKFDILDEDRTNIPAQKIWSQDGDVITMRPCEETDGCTVLKGIGGYNNEYLDQGAVLTAPGANVFYVRQ